MDEYVMWLLIITSGSYIVASVINFGINIDADNLDYELTLEESKMIDDKVINKTDIRILYFLIAMGWVTVFIVILTVLYASIRYK